MALTSSQISSKLFKKALGAGETIVSRQFFEEPRLGRELVLSDQIWSQSNLIPNTAPSLAPGASAGVVYYLQLEPLSHVSGSLNLSYYSSNLIDSIPFNYGDGSYNYQLFKNDGVTPIAFGDGDWIVDNTAGLLTFYGTLPSGVSSALPPKISFYKYIGSKGLGLGSGIGTIIGVTAGSGLIGGGTAGFITLDVNAGNGIDIVSDTVVLGGTLSQNTTINASSYDINIDQLSNFGITSSTFNVYASSSVQITSDSIDLNSTSALYNSQTYQYPGLYSVLSTDLTTGQTSQLIVNSGDSSINVSEPSGSFTVNISLYGSSQSVNDGSLNNNLIIYDQISNKGLVYLDDYSSNFTTFSLVTKGYVDSVVSSVGATNGLSELSSGSVGLGGTLSQNTNIEASGFDFTLSGADNIIFTSSTFDLIADGLVSIDAGFGTIQMVADDDIDIISTGANIYLNSVELYITNTSSNVTTYDNRGLVYTSDYTGTFVTNSLITKKYVDDAVVVINSDFISGVTAGAGISGGGTSGFIDISVEITNSKGLTFSSTGDSGTLEAFLTENGGLTFSTGGGIEAVVDGVTIFVVDGVIKGAAPGVLGVTAGLGLIGGGTTSYITVEVADTIAGNGLTFSSGVMSVNVNSDSLEITGDTLRLKDTITGDRTFQDSITVAGNMTINGTVSYVFTENIYISDNILTLNATWSSGTPFLDAGFEVLRGASQAAVLKWDESQDLWAIGLSGSTSAIITEAGTGLTKSGNTLSIDSTGFASSLAGNGLTSSAGVLNVNVTNGLTIINDDVQISSEVAGAGLTFSSGVIDVQITSSKGLTFSTSGNNGTLEVALKQNGGLTFSTSGDIEAVVDGVTIFVVDGVIKGAAQGVLGVTAGSGLSGGGTNSYITLDVNTGLGLTLSNDDVSIIWGGTSTGLTFSNNALSVSVDGTTIQIVNGQLTGAAQGILGITAGSGLTFSATGSYVTLDVNVGNGISILNDDVVLGGSFSQNTFIDGQFYDFFLTNFDYIQFTSSTFDVESEFISLEAGTGSVQIIAGDQVNISGVDGSFIASNSLSLSSNTFGLQTNGLLNIDSGIGQIQITSDSDINLISNSGDISLTAIFDLLINVTSSTITVSDGRGLVYNSDYSSTFVTHSLVDRNFVDNATASLWSAINLLSGSSIFGLTAGQGLLGGGTAGYLTIDVNTGIGLTISNDQVSMIWGGTSSGLTFSNNSISANVDGTTIYINSNGQLSSVSGASVPVYEKKLSLSTTGDNQSTGFTLSYVPSDYSRIQVFINGQVQFLGDGTSSNVDCYFWNGSIAKNLNNLNITDELYWNGSVSGFDLTTSDVIYVVYEV